MRSPGPPSRTTARLTVVHRGCAPPPTRSALKFSCELSKQSPGLIPLEDARVAFES